jgi:hypothetical protein
MEHAITVEFISHKRKAQCAPNPAYPNGIDLDLTDGAKVACLADLPYPAECCGVLIVRCQKCGSGHAITTAGRTDDPKSVKLPCHGASSVSSQEQKTP